MPHNHQLGITEKSHQTSQIFHQKLQAQGEQHDIFKVMKGKTYSQEYSTQKGFPSGFMEKSKVLQTYTS